MADMEDFQTATPTCISSQFRATTAGSRRRGSGRTPRQGGCVLKTGGTVLMSIVPAISLTVVATGPVAEGLCGCGWRSHQIYLRPTILGVALGVTGSFRREATERCAPARAHWADPLIGVGRCRREAGARQSGLQVDEHSSTRRIGRNSGGARGTGEVTR